MFRRMSWSLLLIPVLLVGSTAEARFGKKSSSPSGQPSPRSSSGSRGSGGNTHQAVPVSPGAQPGGSGRGARGGYYSGRSYDVYQRGYYGGGFYRPRVYMGFGYSSYGYYDPYFYPGSTTVVQQQTLVQPGVQPEPEPEVDPRVTAGIEAQGFWSGFTLGVNAGVEGDRWGFFATGQNIAASMEDGSGGFDHIQMFTAHLSYAFLRGQYGRLRLEGGADAVFAPDFFALGPTFGLSGTVWIGGPFALEASTMLTPWPYWQVDGKLGVALGLGPVGLRAGVRAQMLDDRGWVDGVVHRDVFFGPYIGAGFVF